MTMTQDQINRATPMVPVLESLLAEYGLRVEKVFNVRKNLGVGPVLALAMALDQAGVELDVDPWAATTRTDRNATTKTDPAPSPSDAWAAAEGWTDARPGPDLRVVGPEEE